MVGPEEKAVLCGPEILHSLYKLEHLNYSAANIFLTRNAKIYEQHPGKCIRFKYGNRQLKNANMLHLHSIRAKSEFLAALKLKYIL